MPAAEVDTPSGLVRRLLAEQHPDLAGLTLEPAAHGWDNVTYRLGDELAVRLPRRALGADLIGHEQRWLPALAPPLPLPVPVPVRLGRPGCGYPWAWSVVPWLPGRPAAVAPPADPLAAAVTLGEFLGALHTPAPADAPVNPYRGVPLETRDGTVRERLARLDPASTGQPSCAAGPSRWPWPRGRDPRSGCTATCTRRTSSPNGAPCPR
jgi:aminoglycoside phosphotransferase (APT) family kinase protein